MPEVVCSKCGRRITEYELVCEKRLDETMEELRKRILCQGCQLKRYLKKKVER